MQVTPVSRKIVVARLRRDTMICGPLAVRIWEGGHGSPAVTWQVRQPP
jgi:hypothetical protein